MYLRMTDLLVDLLDRYEPEEGDVEPSPVVSEEPAGVAAFGHWTLLADAALEEAESIAGLVNRLELDEDEEFEMTEGVLSFLADALARPDLVSLLESTDAACDLLEVSGELDVHERSITWHGEGENLEPMPMPLPRPDDEIPLLVEELAIHLLRHAAAPPAREGDIVTYGQGVELYGRVYLLVRDEIDDPAPFLAAIKSAELPAPVETRAHRVEWEVDSLRAQDVYRAVHALKTVSPVVGFAGGVTWRNEPLQVEEPEA